MNIDDVSPTAFEDTLILTKKRLTCMIEASVQENNTGYIEAITTICSARAIDPAEIVSLLSRSIIERVEEEAKRSNMIRHNKESTLFERA